MKHVLLALIVISFGIVSATHFVYGGHTASHTQSAGEPAPGPEQQSPNAPPSGSETQSPSAPPSGPETPSPNAPPDTSISVFDPVNKSITEIFLAILDIIMVFAIPIVVFFIVWAGFLYVTARGSEEQLSKAHKALLYALIGGLLVVGAKVLLEVITNTINVFAG